MTVNCKKCGLDYIHYHSPGRSKKVLALGVDKLDEDKITLMSPPWTGYWKEAPVRSHWVMTSKAKGGTYKFMAVDKIVELFTKGDITFTAVEGKGTKLRMRRLGEQKD